MKLLAENTVPQITSHFTASWPMIFSQIASFLLILGFLAFCIWAIVRFVKNTGKNQSLSFETELGDIDDLKRYVQGGFSPIATPFWGLIVILAVFLLAFLLNDLKVMIVAVFCLCTFALGSINQRQKRITKILLKEIERGRETGNTVTSADVDSPQE